MLKVHASQYWDAHYTFENLSGKISKKKLGTTTSDSILINVICPMMYIYGDYTQDLELKNKAIGFLENIIYCIGYFSSKVVVVDTHSNNICFGGGTGKLVLIRRAFGR